MSLERLMKGARIAVNQCMAIKKGERVLIITDKNMPKELSEALMLAVKETGAECEIKLIEPLKVNGQEPPQETAESMKIPDALFLMTSKSLSHTKARRDASESGVRIASMPKVTEFSFTEGGLTADYQEVKELIEKIHYQLKNAKTIRITSENGTDLEAIIESRKWDEDDGLIHEKGKFCNLPAGEIAVAPVEGTARGIVVIDKMEHYGNNIKYVVKNGFVERIEGSESLEKDVDNAGLKARNIAEIGIGANPNAKVIGNVLEDEKVFGTTHIAIGNNLSFGGKIDVPLHLDGIILKPTLEVDGKVLIKDGKWVFLDDFIEKEVRKNEFKTENKIFPEPKKTKTEFQVTRSKPSYSVSYNQKRKPYEPYIMREPLESHYFDPWIGGWTRLNNRFVINPQLYGYWIKIVEIHEKIHNIYQTSNEAFVERMTRYNFRNGYFNLSGGYS
jgi:leucyl aminopeptidase (aminopeptidase T)